LVIVLIFAANFKYSDSNPNSDLVPQTSSAIYSGLQSFSALLNWNLYFANIYGLNNGTVGAVYFKGKYYLNTWSAQNKCYTLESHSPEEIPDLSTLDSIFSPPYTGSIRDMTVGPDGSGSEYLWGGKAGSVLYKMDSALNVKSEYPIQGGRFRAIAWDPNRKGFWNCDFAGNITCHDTVGNVKGIISAGEITGKYGLAWDSSSSQDSAFLWVWNQQGASLSNTLHKIHIGSGSIIASYGIGLSGNAIAGGAHFVKSGNNSYLLLNFQSTSLACYKLGGAGNSDCTSLYSRDNLSKQILDFTTIRDTLVIEDYTRIPGYIKVVLDTVLHTWVGDLTMTLSHNGITDTLMSRPGRGVGSSFGSNGKNFIGTKLSDDGLISMDSITSFMQPYTSPPNYRPGTHYGMDSLSKFMGTTMNGEWVLSIYDNFGGDQGILNSWGLCFGESTLNISQTNMIPREHILFQNYPNPFNPVTIIKYYLPENHFVTLKVYDITGKEVITLENTKKLQGSHEVTFSGANLSSGVYFYALKAGKNYSVKRMILLK